MQYRRRISATSIFLFILPITTIPELNALWFEQHVLLVGLMWTSRTVRSNLLHRLAECMECYELLCGAASPGNADGGRPGSLEDFGPQQFENLWRDMNGMQNAKRRNLVMEVTAAASQHIVSAIAKTDTVVITLHIHLPWYSFI